MFRKTTLEQQLDLFSSPSSLLSGRALKKYNDPKAWHNVFYKEVTSRIDETLFAPLFKDGLGAPNASVCTLVAMSLIKEGCGCSDEELFDKCDMDLQTRRALGLCSMGNNAPSPATYYNFRNYIAAYAERTGEDLMMKCFEQVTGSQIKAFNISGKSVRMDSKLIGSNIARYSRYVLVHKTMCAALKSYDLSQFDGGLSQKLRGYLEEDAQKTVYRTDKEEMKTRLQLLGECVYELLKAVSKEEQGFHILRRVFDEQFEVKEGKPCPRDKKKIKTDSVQNHNDPEATFRHKGDQDIQGYSTNICETCGEKDKPSIITSVQVESATHADCAYLQEAVETSERVTGDTVERVHADGAYQSPEDREFASKHTHTISNATDLQPGQAPMDLLTGKMQGGARFYLHRNGDTLTVQDTYTGITQEVVPAEQGNKKRKDKGKRWRIPWNVEGGHQWRYFTEEDVRRSELRQKIESLPPEDQKTRNNVEAAMFQYSFHTRNNKTRYRGLAKHRMQAIARCMWMNFRRLAIWLGLPPSLSRTLFQQLPEAISGLWAAFFPFFQPEPFFPAKPTKSQSCAILWTPNFKICPF